MKINKNRIILLPFFLVGIISPFSAFFVVIELFFLLIPFAIIFIGTLAYLITALSNKEENSRNAVLAFSVLPTFVLLQFLSVFTVDNIQRYRSENHIADLQKIKNETGVFPLEYESSMGINYRRLRDKSGFLIEYSRGFMVTEKYNSVQGNWESFGWND